MLDFFMWIQGSLFTLTALWLGVLIVFCFTAFKKGGKYAIAYVYYGPSPFKKYFQANKFSPSFSLQFQSVWGMGVEGSIFLEALEANAPCCWTSLSESHQNGVVRPPQQCAKLRTLLSLQSNCEFQWPMRCRRLADPVNQRWHICES